MQVPQVAAGHLPERKHSVTMMQVHHSNVRSPGLASMRLRISGFISTICDEIGMPSPVAESPAECVLLSGTSRKNYPVTETMFVHTGPRTSTHGPPGLIQISTGHACFKQAVSANRAHSHPAFLRPLQPSGPALMATLYYQVKTCFWKQWHAYARSFLASAAACRSCAAAVRQPSGIADERQVG